MGLTAESLLTGLRDRGLELRLTGNKLQVFDADGCHAWPALTPEEQAYIRADRQRLKAHLASGSGSIPIESLASVRTPVPEACRYCDQAPCIGSDHPAYPALHYMDPEEVRRRDRHATAVMMRMVSRWPY